MVFRHWRYVACVATLTVSAIYPSALAGEVAIRRVELMTVTDTTAALTWQTDRPSNAVVRYGTQAGRLDRTAASEQASARFHHCEIRGLEAGTQYHYVCQSGGRRASVGPLSPGRFTTLTPPPGKERFSFATMTDTHVGQQHVGRLVVNGKVISEGVEWRDPSVPQWRLSVGAAIKEINARRVAFTIIKGDVTHHGTNEESRLARRLLDRLDRPYHVVLGNHDGLKPFLSAFGLARSWYAFSHEGARFLVLDTERIKYGPEAALRDQLSWLAKDLDEHGAEPAFVFVHRPIPPDLQRRTSGLSKTLYRLGRSALQGRFGSRAGGALDRATGRDPAVPPANAGRLVDVLRDHGRTVGVFAGHLHRNYIGLWAERTGNLPYVETASTKEYPCGYAITRVFDGGYMQSYYTPRDPDCLEWSAITRDIYAKVGFGSKVGGLHERNFVVRFDKLDIKPKRTGAAKP